VGHNPPKRSAASDWVIGSAKTFKGTQEPKERSSGDSSSVTNENYENPDVKRTWQKRSDMMTEDCVYLIHFQNVFEIEVCHDAWSFHLIAKVLTDDEQWLGTPDTPPKKPYISFGWKIEAISCFCCENIKYYWAFSPSGQTIARKSLREALQNKQGWLPHVEVEQPGVMVCKRCATWYKGESGRAYLTRLRNAFTMGGAARIQIAAPLMSQDEEVHFDPLAVADSGPVIEELIERMADQFFFRLWNFNSFEEFLASKPEEAEQWMRDRKGETMVEVISDEDGQ